MSTESPSNESQRLAVIGAGSWGTALALVAARHHHTVRMWAREPEIAEGINAAGTAGDTGSGVSLGSKSGYMICSDFRVKRKRQTRRRSSPTGRPSCVSCRAP